MKHKYLEDIGLKYYSDNHFGITNLKEFFRHIKYCIKKRKTGINPRDCWSLDSTFYEWLYEHLCQFVDDADNVVDLTYNKFTHNDKEYNQLEIIEYLKKLLVEIIFFEDNYVYNDSLSVDFNTFFEDYNKRYDNLRKEICDIWCMILPSMWW